MLKIKDNVDLKELEKFGFRKHKRDKKDVIISKWVREWTEADICEGYSCGSSGWDFYPLIEVYEDRFLELHYNRKTYDLLYNLIQAGLVEKV